MCRKPLELINYAVTGYRVKTHTKKPVLLLYTNNEPPGNEVKKTLFLK